MHVTLPKSFWGEVVSTATYLINKIRSSALDFKVREELWYEKPPKYNYLRAFGCLAFAYKRGDKLDPRTKRCVMIGYSKNTKDINFVAWKRKI